VREHGVREHGMREHGTNRRGAHERFPSVLFSARVTARDDGSIGGR
jgi:hypothetical protein